MADPKDTSKDVPKPTEIDIEIDYNTRFLAPPHEEIEAAAVLLRKKFPKLQEELLNECLTDRLNIDGFNKGTVVYVCVRKKFGRQRFTDAQGYREAPDGLRITVHAGAENLAKEVHILGPVKARDHWNESERGWSSELNRATFLTEIGKLAAPWAVMQPDAAGKKNGELPKFVTLATC